MKEKRFKKIVKHFDPEYPKKPSLKNLTSPEWSMPSENRATQFLGAPHVESFNFATDSGLRLIIDDLDPLELMVDGQKVSLDIVDAAFHRPQIPDGAVGTFSPLVYPSEPRQRGSSYKTLFMIQLKVTTHGGTQSFTMDIPMGQVPLMVKSNICNLSKLTPRELVEKGEHPGEWGGYFIIRGHERLIRMLISTRKNYPIAMSRPSWKKRGKHFSEYGILLECSKPDLTTTKNVLHFVTTGSAKFMFSFRRELYFAPAIMILKGLSERTDADIYSHLIQGTSPKDHYYRSCIKSMLTEPHDEGLYSPEQIRTYIGRAFKQKLKPFLPEWSTDEDYCKFLFKHSVCIHLKSDEDKFQMIVFMIKKLFALVQNHCLVEGVDSVMMQEVTLGGHLYLQILKDRLGSWLGGLKSTLARKAKEDTGFVITPTTVRAAVKKQISIEKFIEGFLGTGNLPSSMDCGLMQNAGLTIMAENINRMRYMSHFRAVHRGSFFQEMRTTEVRALLPDAWGFICPVHTPDGSPCGLLNHLSLPTEIITHAPDASKVPQVLFDLGVLPVDQVVQAGKEREDSDFSYSVFLNGRLMGYIDGTVNAKEVADKLRILKVRRENGVPHVMEIVFIPQDENPKLQGLYPGLFLFTGAARMMRPVVNIAADQVEYIGTFEQVFLNICIQPKEAYPGITTHREIRPTTFLSNLALLIPLPDFNQSPRNMYQCQMGKQTMATPIYTWHLNSETKIYRLQTPASPFFRPVHYDYLKMDEFPMGTNAIVAVISYTGYDMEDAMIINKSSFERGFCAGSIYKSSFIDLKELSTGKRHYSDKHSCEFYFQRDPKRVDLSKYLDADGLPYPGIPLSSGDPLYSYRNSIDDSYTVKKYDGNELAFVDSVKILSNDSGTSTLTRVSICYRIPRNPSVGDKFASRAGQKGICSRKWITEDLPWTESGIHPDIIFNPHGFPSRMTIAMMVECMAGKSGAAHGMVHDASPFTFSEDKDNDAIDFFGKQLESAGYNYYGTETMYSGTDGVEMKAEIFFGVIHYQRLRHMVSDKFQVRSKGAVDQVMRQPIKGRRRGGGVRFGEMERDALLSHGSMFLLQDRLFHGSDKTRVQICTRCGSLLSPRVSVSKKVTALGGTVVAGKTHCVICKKGDKVSEMDLPYVFLHLVAQLAGVNIKVKLETTHN